MPAPASTIQLDPSPRGQVLLASSARTANGSLGVNTDSFDVNGLTLFVDVTAVSGTTPSLTLTVQGSVPPTFSKQYTVGTSTDLTTGSITGVTTKKLVINPQIPNSATVAQDLVPPYLYLSWAITGTTPSFTFSVTALLDM